MRRYESWLVTIHSVTGDFGDAVRNISEFSSGCFLGFLIWMLLTSVSTVALRLTYYDLINEDKHKSRMTKHKTNKKL